MEVREALDLAVKIGGGVAAALLPIVSLGHRALKRSMVSREEFDAHRVEQDKAFHSIDSRLQASEARFARVEERLAQMPTQGDIRLLIEQLNAVRIEMTRLGGEINVAKEALSATRHSVGLLVETHMGDK